jgi:hypothetical protein
LKEKEQTKRNFGNALSICSLFCVNIIFVGFPIQTDEQFKKFDEELKKHRELDEVSITSIL